MSVIVVYGINLRQEKSMRSQVLGTTGILKILLITIRIEYRQCTSTDASRLPTKKKTFPSPHFFFFLQKTLTIELKLTLKGTVCGAPNLDPQYPLRMGTKEILARVIAPRIALATSLEHFTPRPTCPL